MIAIRTPDQRLRIFISSTMKELADARAAARSAIERLRLTPVLFELGARPYPPRQLYLAYLRHSDVFIGIYGQQYGWIAPDQQISGLEDEYVNAGGMPKLVYVQSPAPDRDPRLTAMLSRIQSDGLSYRGFATSEELGALIADDLALLLSERFDLESEPPEDVRPTRPLPAPASRFIGRQREMSTVRDLLTDVDARLVTLVGAGGIGKTRLALEVGTSLTGMFDGAVMVALDEVSSADLVVSSIASSLGVPESLGRSLLDLVISYLRTRRMLLIIDNFEQVLAAADVLGQLISQTDQTVLLVTSRERLRLSGEHVVEVPPLQIPGTLDNDEVLRRSDAVELFVDRARAAGSDLDLDHGRLETIAEVCRRLDGIPLAIELAASRVKVVGPEELLRRLSHRLSFLTGGPRDLPLRQQTLRSTIAWSHDLLDDSERRLFARLGVFAADFSLEAAETVCADEAGPAVLDGIASLLDKSLIRTEDPLRGQPRFTMLQVVRDFALEQLEAFGETERVRRAHADYFQGVIIAAEATLRRDPDPVVEQYRADQANIRAVIRWSLDVKEGGRVARMALAMWPFLWIAGLLTEGVEVMQEALLDEPALSAAERAHAHLALGMLAFGQGDYDRAAPALTAAIDAYTQLGDVQHAATASVPLGVIQAVGDANGGEDLLARAAETFRELDDQWGLAFALLSLGGALLLHHRYVDAIPPLEEGIQLARAAKADVFLSNALINLGWVHHRLGDLESARKQLGESVQHAAVLDNRESLARALDALAAVADTAGDPELGATMLGAGEGVRHSIGAVVWMTDRTSHDETAAELRTALGDRAYRAATDRGRGLTIDQVLQMTSARNDLAPSGCHRADSESGGRAGAGRVNSEPSRRHPMSSPTVASGADTTEHSPARFDVAEYLRRAERVIPQGASAGGRPLFRDVITSARGAYLTSGSGKQYIDHLLSYGPIVLGHADQYVNEAVKRTIDRVDLNWVGPQAGEVELCERLVRQIPSAEKVVLLNTGTDALQHALHVARAATGQRRILKFHGHYHGWAGELGTGANFDVEPGRAPAPDAPNSGGATPEAARDVLVVDWNDATAVHAAFHRVGSEIAAVFAEPYLHSYTNAAPAPGFLELLRELTTRFGSLLVFDEVKTGFRHHLGGYQSIAGVTPDLTALGKALGNGYTIAALVGRADLMDLLGTTVTIDGTYYANPYATAAALATLDQLELGGIERLWQLGQRLRDGLTKAIADSGIEANVTGIGSGWIINWRAEPPITFRQAVDADFDRGEAFRVAMLDAGILLPPYVITDARICVAFTNDDIDATIDAARYALASVR